MFVADYRNDFFYLFRTNGQLGFRQSNRGDRRGISERVLLRWAAAHLWGATPWQSSGVCLAIGLPQSHVLGSVCTAWIFLASAQRVIPATNEAKLVISSVKCVNEQDWKWETLKSNFLIEKLTVTNRRRTRMASILRSIFWLKKAFELSASIFI